MLEGAGASGKSAGDQATFLSYVVRGYVLQHPRRALSACRSVHGTTFISGVAMRLAAAFAAALLAAQGTHGAPRSPPAPLDPEPGLARSGALTAKSVATHALRSSCAQAASL